MHCQIFRGTLFSQCLHYKRKLRRKRTTTPTQASNSIQEKFQQIQMQQMQQAQQQQQQQSSSSSGGWFSWLLALKFNTHKYYYLKNFTILKWLRFVTKKIRNSFPKDERPPLLTADKFTRQELWSWLRSLRHAHWPAHCIWVCSPCTSSQCPNEEACSFVELLALCTEF